MARLFGFVWRGRGGNYAYVNARVRARSASLLPPETYPKLVARDLPEIARALQEGRYQKEIDELAGKYRGAELIDRATRLHLGRTYDEILSYSEGELRSMLALYMERYDVQNLKTIIRGKFGGSSTQEILNELLPLGTLPRRELERLASHESLEDVLSAIAKTPYGPAVKELADAHQRPASLLELENALDKLHYRRVDDAVDYSTAPKAAFQAYLRREIDVVNLRTVFRLKAERMTDLANLHVEGGRDIDVPAAQRILRADGDELAAEVASLTWWKGRDEAVRAFLDGRGLNPVMTSLDRCFLSSAMSFGHAYPLSVLPVIGFLLRKKFEVDNLRIIAYGKQTGLREETIQELVLA